MKNNFIILFFCFSIHAFTQAPCGLTLVQLYSHTSPCNACSDTIVVAGIGGQGALSFVWSNSQTNDTAVGLCPGTYTCTVTDTANCTSTGTFTLNAMPPLLVSTTFNNATCDTCCNGSAYVANIVNGNPPYSILWSNNATTDTIHGLCPGKFTVCVTDALGCSNCDTVEIGSPSGIFSPIENHMITVFPNPVIDEIKLSITGDLLLTDASGRILRSVSNANRIDVSDLACGIYILTIGKREQVLKQCKIVKQ